MAAQPMLRVATVSLVILSTGLAVAQEFPQPTEFHKQLAREAGVWNATAKVWMQPGAEPMLSKGKETCKMLGGFWLVSKYEGEFFGMPYTGHGQTGYDPVKGEYVSTWIDSMTSDLMVTRGQYDVATHTLTLEGEGRDAQTGALEKLKLSVQYPDEQHKQMKMYHAGQKQGEWVKVMEIDYTRAE